MHIVKTIRFPVLVLLCLSFLMTGCTSTEKAQPPVDGTVTVAGTNGAFVGLTENGVISFKGIPYAKPPVGDLRWRAPVAAEPGDQVLECFEYGDAAPQYEWFSEPASYYKKSEDCLTLNVWTADVAPSEKKPVMVWIHGGAWGWGGTADPMYDGRNFVEAHNDIVLITINYRLGILGFMDITGVPGGEDYVESSNLGLLDSIEALRWINKNVAAFGGDPNNITVFGESAGAGSISILLTVEEVVDGLVHKAILQSGAMSSWTFIDDKEESRAMANYLMEVSGAETLEDLMALSADDLMELDTEYWIADELAGIVPDGEKIPLDPLEVRRNGLSKDIDIMVGTTSDEYRYWIGELEGLEYYEEWMNWRFDELYESASDEDKKLIDEFMAMEDEDRLWRITEIFNEADFRLPAIMEAEDHSSAGGSGSTYMYYWTYPSALENYGACHAVDLAFVFNNLEDDIYLGKPADPGLAKKIQEAWVNFAKTGNPSTSNMEWPEYDTRDRATMIMDLEWKVENDLLSKSRKIIESLMKYVM